MPKVAEKPTLASVLADVHLRPIEAAIVRLLSDGEPHSVKEVLALIGDEMTTKKNLQDHVSNIRKKIAPYGHDIVHTLELRRTNYRYIISLKYHVA